MKKILFVLVLLGVLFATMGNSIYLPQITAKTPELTIWQDHLDPMTLRAIADLKSADTARLFTLGKFGIKNPNNIPDEWTLDNIVNNKAYFHLTSREKAGGFTAVNLVLYKSGNVFSTKNYEFLWKFCD